MKKMVFYVIPLVMVMTLGSWFTGCATFKIDEGSITEEAVTLQSVDLAALIAEYVQAWQPAGLGAIMAPDEPGDKVIISLANEWGYTEDLSGPISITISTANDKDSLPYPQAKVSKFTATDKAGAKREGVKIQSRVTYPPVYRVAQKQEGKVVMGEKNLAIFLTQSEADAYADKIRPDVPEGISIEVGSHTPAKLLTCTLFKPL
ncbi:MAG: hypothetical protein LBS06_07010 [Treponema sp.]|jgi:hypothetical protein|nr:hypothetical protein [Treponema sp.]